jgi:hypothetical protein
MHVPVEKYLIEVANGANAAVFYVMVNGWFWN